MPLFLLSVQVEQSKGDESDSTLCFTGLSRLTDASVRAALEYVGSASMKLKTIFVFEHYPNV